MIIISSTTSNKHSEPAFIQIKKHHEPFPFLQMNTSKHYINLPNFINAFHSPINPFLVLDHQNLV